MTSQSHTASVGATRRPAPPRPAPVQHARSAPVTYEPPAYDPRQAQAATTVPQGTFGLVYPKPRTGRAVWVVLLLIVAAVAGLLGWRVMNTGSASSSSVMYTSTAGHFTARFPSQPTESVSSEQHGRWRVDYHTVAVVREAVVVEGSVHGPIPGDGKQLAAQMVRRFTQVGDFELSGVKDFTFFGQQARQGTFFLPDGEAFTVLMTTADARRMYMLAAPLGSQFQALKESFHPQP